MSSGTRHKNTIFHLIHHPIRITNSVGTSSYIFPRSVDADTNWKVQARICLLERKITPNESWNYRRESKLWNERINDFVNQWNNAKLVGAKQKRTHRVDPMTPFDCPMQKLNDIRGSCFSLMDLEWKGRKSFVRPRSV